MASVSGSRRDVNRNLAFPGWARAESIISIVIAFCCIAVVGKPFVPSRSNGNQPKTWDFDDNVQNYLMEFGYLPKSNIETGNLRTMEQLEEAVRLFQNFANLNPTGKIDRDTLDLMRKPRCGAPDLPSSLDFMPSNSLSPVQFQHRRHRRFIIQGQKWEHPVVTWSKNETSNHGDMIFDKKEEVDFAESLICRGRR